MKGMYFFNVLFFYFPPPLSAIPSGKGMYFCVFVFLQSFSSCRLQHSIREKAWALEYVGCSFKNITN